MKKLIIIATIVFISSALYAEKKSIEAIRSGANDIALSKVKVEIPDVKVTKKVVKEDTAQPVSQDLIYKFNNVKDEMLRIKNDTVWLRSDMNRLLDSARRIKANNQQDSWFSYDLRDMAYKMSRWYNDIDRLYWDLRNLLNIAKKDEQLNKIAKDIEWYAWDIENTFDFSLENTARDLEYTVRSIDPKLVGYDAQWSAYDISRYTRDISYKARDMHWDARDLVSKTQP